MCNISDSFMQVDQLEFETIRELGSGAFGSVFLVEISKDGINNENIPKSYENIKISTRDFTSFKQPDKLFQHACKNINLFPRLVCSHAHVLSLTCLCYFVLCVEKFLECQHKLH